MVEVYEIPNERRKHLMVDVDVHTLVHVYAAKHQISMVEAAYRILSAGLIQLEGWDVPRRKGKERGD